MTSLVEYFLPFGSLHWVCRNSRYSSWDWKVSIDLSSLYALDSIDLTDVVVDDEDDMKDNDDTVDVDCDDVDDERILRCWLKYLLMTGNLYDKQHDNTYNNNNIAQDFNINTMNLINQTRVSLRNEWKYNKNDPGKSALSTVHYSQQ